MVKKIDNNFDEDNSINIRGARQHNLKNINLSLPRNKFIVFTGVSGVVKVLWPLILFLLKVKEDMLRVFLHTQGNFWVK